MLKINGTDCLDVLDKLDWNDIHRANFIVARMFGAHGQRNGLSGAPPHIS